MEELSTRSSGRWPASARLYGSELPPSQERSRTHAQATSGGRRGLTPHRDWGGYMRHGHPARLRNWPDLPHPPSSRRALLRRRRHRRPSPRHAPRLAPRLAAAWRPLLGRRLPPRLPPRLPRRARGGGLAAARRAASLRGGASAGRSCLRRERGGRGRGRRRGRGRGPLGPRGRAARGAGGGKGDGRADGVAGGRRRWRGGAGGRRVNG